MEESGIHNCNNQLYYIPDSLFSMKYIRVNVHFMDDSTGTRNFSMEEGKQFMRALIHNANQRLGENEKMNLPPDNNTPALQTRYRYSIHSAGISPEDDGFYKHLDNELFYYVNKGKNRNNYDRRVLQKYSIGEDSIMNIFVLPHHPDSLLSKTYKAHGTGIALGTSLKMAGLYEHADQPWSFATLLNHEIGHILGLSHSWLKHDRCDDTPPHPNCWDNHGPPPCDEYFSNNMMDYNASQMAITPCQLGIIHKGFNKSGSRNRAFLKRDWCKADFSKTIVIDTSTNWYGARDLSHDIIVEEDIDLHIYCRLSMAENTMIILRPGAQLHLHDALLHNDCGLQWMGIEIQKTKKKEAQVFLYENAEIQNTSSPGDS